MGCCDLGRRRAGRGNGGREGAGRGRAGRRCMGRGDTGRAGCIGAGGAGTGREPGAQVLPLFPTTQTKGTVPETLLPKAGKSSREERQGALTTRQAGAIGVGIAGARESGARESSTDSPPTGDGGVSGLWEGVAPMLTVWPIAQESMVGLGVTKLIPRPLSPELYIISRILLKMIPPNTASPLAFRWRKSVW